jgi:hypothetical protein
MHGHMNVKQMNRRLLKRQEPLLTGKMSHNFPGIEKQRFISSRSLYQLSYPDAIKGLKLWAFVNLRVSGTLTWSVQTQAKVI